LYSHCARNGLGTSHLGYSPTPIHDYDPLAHAFDMSSTPLPLSPSSLNNDHAPKPSRTSCLADCKKVICGWSLEVSCASSSSLIYSLSTRKRVAENSSVHDSILHGSFLSPPFRPVFVTFLLSYRSRLGVALPLVSHLPLSYHGFCFFSPPTFSPSSYVPLFSPSSVGTYEVSVSIGA